MSFFKCVIPSHPGYSWEHRNGVWTIVYAPVKGMYSPPCLHPLIRSIEIPVPTDLHLRMGRLIGKNGDHFKRLTESSKCDYIFYLPDRHVIEVWGSDHAVHRASRQIHAHLGISAK
jgi:hypothetical protein